MLTRAKAMTLRHWDDPALLDVVYQDLRKSGWAELRAVSLDLPPCACCHQDSSFEPTQQESATASPEHSHTRSSTCSTTAHGIAGTVREESSNRDTPEIGLTKVVFAVSAACAIPTRRFSDVVAAAEEYIRFDDRTAKHLEEGRRLRVLAAFCDGSSIIYYTVSGGISTS